MISFSALGPSHQLPDALPWTSTSDAACLLPNASALAVTESTLKVLDPRYPSLVLDTASPKDMHARCSLWKS
jgi:hypothetical protein